MLGSNKVSKFMDGTFHAIATILHRDPRDGGKLRGKPKGDAPPQGDRDPGLGDIRDGWIRFAL